MPIRPRLTHTRLDLRHACESCKQLHPNSTKTQTPLRQKVSPLPGSLLRCVPQVYLVRTHAANPSAMLSRLGPKLLLPWRYFYFQNGASSFALCHTVLTARPGHRPSSISPNSQTYTKLKMMTAMPPAAASFLPPVSSFLKPEKWCLI